MVTPILLHRSGSQRPALTLSPGVALALGRVHEGCGPGRRLLAALIAGRLSGPVIWIHPAAERERLNPDGLARIADPGRFVLVPARRPADLYWCMEEALRSGAVALVVAEVADPPALTPVRRLHLAAEAGGAAGVLPLGLLLTPGTGGAQGVESRWHLAPLPDARWQITPLRSRLAPGAAEVISLGG